MQQRELTLARTGRIQFHRPPGVGLQWAKAQRQKTPRVSKRQVVSVPSGCSLACLVMADPKVLPKAKQGLILHLLNQVPPLANAITVRERLSGRCAGRHRRITLSTRPPRPMTDARKLNAKTQLSPTVNMPCIATTSNAKAWR